MTHSLSFVNPTMFVGSTSEEIRIAEAIQINLRHTVDVIPWSQHSFLPSESPLESLLTAAQKYDFGVFVLSPDDLTYSRDKLLLAPRDNVLFECGMFFGRLGRRRAFFIIPTVKDFKIPSDLLGITALTYTPGSHDGNTDAMLGPACTIIKRMIQSLMPSKATSLNGAWNQKWFVENSESYVDGGSGSEAVVKHIGDEFIAYCKDGEHTFQAKGTLKGNFITGVWSNPQNSTYYFGAFELFVHPRLHRLEGSWLGHRTNNTIGGGRWLWTRS